MSEAGREILVDEKQREAERDALRKVRGAIDGIESQEQRVQRVRRSMVMVAGALAVLPVLLIAMLVGRSGEVRGPPVVLPSSPAQGQTQQKQAARWLARIELKSKEKDS